MPEGLGPAEVGKEISEHTHHTAHREEEGRDRIVTIIEAALLAIVAFIAAYTGYASAKWSTESRLDLSRATAARTESSKANLAAIELSNGDSTSFNAWFTAYVANDARAMALAVKRFRPEYRVAFDAWQRTNPATNPNAPPGPAYMPEYKQPDLVRANEFDAKADEEYAAGAESGTNADDYVRVTVYLAMVLFLVAISGHFRVRGARYGLVIVGFSVLILAVGTLTTLAAPP